MGKGRPKGYSPYTYISYEELGDWVGRKTRVKVSRAWLDDLRGSPAPSTPTPEAPPRSMEEILCDSPEEPSPKIEFNLTTFDNE